MADSSDDDVDGKDVRGRKRSSLIEESAEICDKGKNDFFLKKKISQLVHLMMILMKKIKRKKRKLFN